MSKTKKPEDETQTGGEGSTATATAPAAAATSLPTPGRIIMVTDDEGDVMPAIVNKRIDNDGDGRVDLNVCLFNPIMGTGNAFISNAAEKQRDKSGERGTWCWPPRA